MNAIDSPLRPIVRRAVVGLAAAALTVSACGSGDAPASTDGAAGEAVSSAVTPEDASVSSEGSGAQALQQNGPITVDGSPLDPFDGSTDDLALGQTAPVVSGESFDGTPITIGGPTANRTMVVFLAHWCPHCNDEIPELLALEAAGDIPEGLDVVGVSTAVDPNADNYPPSDWVVAKGWEWPTVADDEELAAFGAFGGTSFPFIVVLDSDGTVLARRAGSATAADTKAFLDTALAG